MTNSVDSLEPNVSVPSWDDYSRKSASSAFSRKTGHGFVSTRSLAAVRELKTGRMYRMSASPDFDGYMETFLALAAEQLTPPPSIEQKTAEANLVMWFGFGSALVGVGILLCVAGFFLQYIMFNVASSTVLAVGCTIVATTLSVNEHRIKSAFR